MSFDTVKQANILDPGFSLNMRPMRYPGLFQHFVNAQKNNWSVQEISFATDLVDLREKITPAELHVIKRVASFWSQADQAVANNACLSLYRHVNSPEARCYYGRQIFEESLHVEFYLNLLDSYIPDSEERIWMANSVENIPSIRKKAEFSYKWMEQMDAIPKLETKEHRRTFLMNLIAFCTTIEGIFFLASFAYVYFLRDRGLLHGLGSGTNWVFRDESCHMNFAYDVIDIIRKEEPDLWDGMEDRIREMFHEAIDCEMQFAHDTLGEGVIGLSLEDMHEYIKYTVDGHCARLGMSPMFNAKCPFDFMLKQDIQALTSFFERTVAEYTVGIGGDINLDTEEDF